MYLMVNGGIQEVVDLYSHMYNSNHIFADV